MLRAPYGPTLTTWSYSVVWVSVMARRVEDSSTMALSWVKAAMRDCQAMLLTERGRPPLGWPG
jgi:hypothetical protein